MNRKKVSYLLLVIVIAWMSPILTAQTVVYDDSDASFSILAQMVTVLTPNGGENWNGGEAHNITWSLDASVTNVNIDYSIDSGNSWTPVAVNIANSGTNAWTVPATVSTECLVRVSAVSNAGNNDISNRIFSISSASTETVTAPSQPSGPASGSMGNSYTFNIGGANSNFADALQYKFDWGDGTDSGWLATGTTSAVHIWGSVGTYQVRAMARCAEHTTIESPCSERQIVTISGNIPLLQWNTFLAASDVAAIATDSSGNIYLTGDGGFWQNPLNPQAGGAEAYVAKLNANGVLLWATFLGSHFADFGEGIAVDNSGNIYVTGTSYDTWGSPLRAFSGSPGYTYDGFVAKLNASGTLLWNTFLGGANIDYANAIAIGNSGDIFVGGSSRYDWGTPINPFSGSDFNGFVARLNTDGALQWLTFSGGPVPSIHSIALDNTGNIYLMGESEIAWGSPLNPYTGNREVCVLKINASGTRAWQTFLGGGDSVDHGCDLALDNSGNIFITGYSSSSWGSPLIPYGGGNSDAFAAKLNAGGARVWNTFFGGSDLDQGSGITLDSSSNIYVTGWSNSSWGSPLNPYRGGGDAFLAKFNLNGTLQWNTFMGGNSYDGGNDITIDSSLNIIMTGKSHSSWGSPSNPYDGSANANAFVAKLGFNTNTLLFITSPNGGENWLGGSAQNITWWNSPGTITNVNIDYSTDSGGNWTAIASGTTNTGHYAWTVPNTPSTTCLVRVSDTDGEPVDQSGSVFTIAAMGEAVSAPNAPAGPIGGPPATSFEFSTGGAACNLGHVVQYKFDWGDGMDSGWLAVGTTSAEHAWAASGNYQVQAMARCVTHTDVESPWSDACTIIIHDGDISLLQWHTFMGGSNYENGGRNTVDNSGNIFVIGNSDSSWGSPLNPFKGVIDTFVAKFNASGVLQWHTFLGGTNYDYGNAITLDTNGNIYVTGRSASTWGTPLNPYSGGNDAYVAKLSASGVLQWNTFLGSNDSDNANNITLDNSGNIYITGDSYSTWGSPLNPFFGTGVSDTFIAKLNTNGARQWHTFLGGSNTDSGVGIALDNSGNIYVSGISSSSWGSPLNPYGGGSYDAFAAKFNASGVMQWNTFMGGSDSDYGRGIALDIGGNIFVTGYSDSTWGSPLNPFSGSGTSDAFIVKLNSDGARQWNTFFGGNSNDIAIDSTLDNSGNIFVTGYSNSSWGTPIQAYTALNDGFVAKINTNGVMQWNMFMGGSGNDYGYDIALDISGNIFVIGYSDSTWGSPLNPFSGNSDIFIAKLATLSNSLTVNSPNGGENWTGGSDYNITWNPPSTITKVNIDYSIDNGSSWTLVAASIANNGTYTWTVPATPSTNCLVRISDAANSGMYDVSNGVFTIATAITATLIVISPNGGESWINGSAQNITWCSTGTIANVNIDYSTNSGSSWTSVVASITNSGTYAWTVPATPSTNCLMRISDAANAGTFDVSNGVFTITSAVIATLTVISPNGGENWTVGDSHNITWSSTGTVTNVNIDYSIDSGGNWTPVAANIGNSGSFSWTVPATLSTTCLVRVSDAADGNPADSSNAAFTISAPTPYVTVTSPNGGEQWQQGTPQTITWTSSGVANIKIELYKGTKRNSIITSSVPASNGSYSWTISSSQTVGSDYTIRIQSTATSTITDSSNANFSIFAPAITVIAPATGAAWQRGVNHTIMWTSQGTMDSSVKILLYKGTKLDSTLATTTPNDGSFDWIISANQALATTYKIRIITVDGLITGNSGAFAITASGGLTLLSPNDSERLAASAIYPVPWTVDPEIREVKLEFSRDNSGTFTLIADNIPNTGYFEWNVPVNFTFNGIIRVSDSYGRNWFNEYGVLETTFNFICSSQKDKEQPDIIMWHGGSGVNSPGFGFARVSVGRDSVQMAEVSRAIEPLNNGWHEVKIRLDLKRDLGTVFIDGKPMLENIALYTSKEHHFEPYITIRSGNGPMTDLMLSGLLVQVKLISDDGNEKGSFTVLNEDFSGYDDRSNTINSCWQVMGLSPVKPMLGIKTLTGAGRVLWMGNFDGAALTISKPLSIPETIPFDISDRSFIIEMRPEVDR